MKREILRVGAPSLSRVAEAVGEVDDPAVRRDAADLLEALMAFREAHGFGRAIAAPQIGIDRRMIALAVPGWPDVIVNPEIVWTSAERVTLWDDCMCFPDTMVKVARYASISVRCVDLSGEVHLKAQLPLAEAELLQHEIDHLDGKLSFDRAVGENATVPRSEFEANRAAFARQVDYCPQP
ncbi:Peptide deformylase [Pandoraea pneumonica]|uniref:Peptide deformylase n=1 Tax=Pandoraea pneumonica TaxID=2508299 RepID=A0A5E4TEW9_9BURK|nr:peptide deformylase [Pandoraea pneumonica]VVD86061.1 Peptide deformylase [Pandoraea pneumonica]